MSKLGLFIFCILAKFLSRLNKKRIIDHRINITGSAQKYLNWREETNFGKLKNIFSIHKEINLRNKTIMDFGCSAGGLCKIISRFNPEKIIGIDSSKHALEVAIDQNSAANIIYKQGFKNKIPLKSNSIDYIFCFDVLEHVMDINSIFSEMVRVLKPKGRIFIEWVGWYGPFSAHLYVRVPIPWVQVLFSEKTIFRGLAKIYDTDWYIPGNRQIDKETGKKKENLWKYTKTFYELGVNTLTISQFKRIIKKSPNIKILEWKKSIGGNKYFNWFKMFTKLPVLKEFFTIYNIIALEKLPDKMI